MNGPSLHDPAERRSLRRYVIAAMLFLAAVLNYIDRQTLSLLAMSIRADLKLDDSGYADVANLFLLGYTVSLVLSGRLVDRLGTRAGMALFVAFWSVANMLTATARSLASLGLFRFLLGLGEAGNWPASAKTVSEWFPPAERAAAIGLYTMGATLGATVAPLLILALKARYGWQGAFVVTGMMGLVWIVPWLLMTRRPDRAAQGPAPPAAAEPALRPAESEGARWRAVLGRRDVWLVAAARLLTDPVFYFYQFWFATYLQQARGLDEQQAGVLWVIFLAADVGALLGGLASGWFIRRGLRPPKARLAMMFAAACLMPLSPLVATLPGVAGALAIASVAMLAHMAWLVNITSLLVDLVPQRLLGTGFGVAAAASAVGGIAMNKLVAYCAAGGLYPQWFLAMAFLHPAAWLLLWMGGILRPQDESET